MPNERDNLCISSISPLVVTYSTRVLKFRFQLWPKLKLLPHITSFTKNFVDRQKYIMKTSTLDKMSFRISLLVRKKTASEDYGTSQLITN